jgi:acetate CoA/acetoacetate CoA-transferase alpha subunit
VNKILSIQEAIERVENGMTVMLGGFLGVGAPDDLIDALVEKGVMDLTIICNDTSFPDRNIGKLIVNGMVKKVYTSHIGTNPETGRLMHDGKIEVVLTPQGTLAEQVRAGGAGLGGVITPTGLGTVVEEGKEKIVIDGQTFIVEKPLKADVALIKGHKVDKKGNVVYDKAARNFNPLMATAATVVIVEADEIVEIGALDPDHVHTPGIFVTYIVQGGQNNG